MRILRKANDSPQETKTLKLILYQGNCQKSRKEKLKTTPKFVPKQDKNKKLDAKDQVSNGRLASVI
jgi:hypothetical protein